MYGGGNILKYEGWNVGSTIRRLRKEKNMTIEELSEAACLPSIPHSFLLHLQLTNMQLP